MLEGKKEVLMKKFQFWGVHSNEHGNIFNGFRLNQIFNQSSRRVWEEKKSSARFQPQI